MSETASPQTESAQPLLDVRGLVTEFHSSEGVFKAVDGVSFAVARGETLGIVGESGCGKSVTSLSVMGLIPRPPGKIPAGEIVFEGRDLLTLSSREMRDVRGNDISMIFQEPMTSLNPVYTVGQQIMEGILLHEDISEAEARERAIEMLRLVRIPSPESRVDDFPHQMSGGMRQRVMIAMALACNPKLLIADEPTTALDVTIQAQILDLMRDLRERTGTAIMLITHDLGVIAELADRVVVMYAGKVVEEARVGDLFTDPQHPYTLGLLGSIPKLDVEEERLATIEGSVPNPYNMPAGCKFNPRCPFADDKCRQEVPVLAEVKPGHKVACWKAPLENTIL
ncbi:MULTISPECIES: ABC transporter ATP-binding protein [Oceanibaculum]|uniref:Peptide/nickel transport system ATP-binding protein/oligopeptide transport system ATP-binding protein n=1 Tax=Oceanibaculum indicum TaxID=526216 RepID=A0A420WHK7_9PROT|nr:MULTISPECIES: ABC transporter ATP-binding protein [Oceanibaculum]MCH2393920.1 ABC transporter ATP-binding protein [Oceanibaculum sp.]RKQ70483.1 peptide/nickel transport system ATP-binding protein/oligopeptide transport system ATP-binding protein [Oceanibaculum indicum]